MANARGSEAGFTLLELALSLALGTVVLTAFLVTYQGFMGTVSLAAGDISGTTNVSELFDTIARDVDQATAISSVQWDTLSMTVNGQPVIYRLISGSAGATEPGVASRDVYVEREVAGVRTPVGPRRTIANWHPYPGTLKAADGVTDVSGTNRVDFFTLDSTPGRAPQVILHAVVQAREDAPTRYVRTRATPRAL